MRLRRGGSRRHLRGRIAFQADTEEVPLSGGVAPGYSRYSLPGWIVLLANVLPCRVLCRVSVQAICGVLCRVSVQALCSVLCRVSV